VGTDLGKYFKVCEAITCLQPTHAAWLILNVAVAPGATLIDSQAFLIAHLHLWEPRRGAPLDLPQHLLITAPLGHAWLDTLLSALLPTSGHTGPFAALPWLHPCIPCPSKTLGREEWDHPWEVTLTTMYFVPRKELISFSSENLARRITSLLPPPGQKTEAQKS
jgi:hypothetical protein